MLLGDIPNNLRSRVPRGARENERESKNSFSPIFFSCPCTKARSQVIFPNLLIYVECAALKLNMINVFKLNLWSCLAVDLPPTRPRTRKEIAITKCIDFFILASACGSDR